MAAEPAAEAGGEQASGRAGRDRDVAVATVRLAALVVPSLGLGVGALLLALHERPQLPRYRQQAFRLLFARDEPAGVALLLVLLAVALAAAMVAAGPLRRWAEAVPRRLAERRALVVVALTAVLLLAAGAVTIYQARPLAMDEYAHWFQARAFAAGELTGRFPPDLVPRLVPPRLLFPFFAVDPATGTVASRYWPGFALLLVPFTWLHAPWLLNPLLGGAALLLLAVLARRWTGEAAAAGWAVLLALASPAFTMNALSFYPLTAHLLLNLAWMTLLVEGRAELGETGAMTSPAAALTKLLLTLTEQPWRLLAAGAVGSLALVLHNPVPHAVFALPWLAALLRRRGLRAAALLALGYLPLVLLLGAGWLPLRGPLASEAAAGDGLASRALDLLAHVFTRPTAPLLYARFLALGELVTWAAPFLPVLAVFGWLAVRRASPLRLLAGSALATLLLYCFIPFDQGHGWGYRYFHAAWSALPLLGAAALVDPRATRWRGPVLAAALLAIPAANALRAGQVHSFIAEQRAELPPLPAAPYGGRYLCFVSLQGGAYRVDLLQNDPFLRDPVTYLASYGFERDAALVARRFPGATLASRDANGSVWRLLPS